MINSRCFFALLLISSACKLHAATIEVAVSNFRYTPNDVTIQVGDTVRWTNSGGVHNVVADDGSFGNSASGSAWTFSRTFNTPGEVLYHCQVHSIPGQNINTSMNGRIFVETPAPPPPPPFTINMGLNGGWFNPPTAGQGFLVDILPTAQFMFVAWFSFEVASGASAAKLGAPEQRWLSAQGNYAGKRAELSLFKTTGGVFNTPRTTTTTPIGTLVLEFSDCNNASATYSIPGENLTGSIPLQRLFAGNDGLCLSLANANTNPQPAMSSPK